LDEAINCMRPSHSPWLAAVEIQPGLWGPQHRTPPRACTHKSDCSAIGAAANDVCVGTLRRSSDAVATSREGHRCQNASVHIQGIPTGAACTFKMRPTTAPSASTSKSFSSHLPEVRLAEARLSSSTVIALHVRRLVHCRRIKLGFKEKCQFNLLGQRPNIGRCKQQFSRPLPSSAVFSVFR